MHEREATVNLLVVATVAIYAVVATGAAIGSSALSGACPSWPFCPDVGTLLAGGEPLVLIHRGLTLVAGLGLALGVLAVHRSSFSGSVRTPVYLAAGLFPAQILLGASLLVRQSTPYVQLHLLIAVCIFLCLLLGLGRALSEDTAEGLVTDQSTSETEDNTPKPTPSSANTSDPTSATGDSPAVVVRAYLELTKPRLMWLLCLLALAGMALATTTGATIDGLTVTATLAGGILAIGASGTFNHVFEYDRDKRMERTSDRPVATAQVTRARATVFGLVLMALSLVLLWTLTTPMATLLTLVAVIYYSVIYTVILKPNTSWNIALGGGAGALPAVIGWAAVTGGIGLPALALAGLVVIWTPAHFYNLAIVYRDDYARAGYPMYSVVAGIRATRRRILTTLGGTLLVTAVLGTVAPVGTVFVLATVTVGAVFLASVVVQFRRRTKAATLRSFHASNAYLAVVLAAIITEAILIGL